MNVKLKLKKVESIPCEVILTGPLADFAELCNQLPSAWPASSLRFALHQAIDQANKTFEGEPNE